MPADQPTILATSGGVGAADRISWGVGPLTDLAVDLSGVEGRAPKVCFLGTACGDSPALVRDFYAAAQARGFHGSHLQLFTMPNVEDITAHLLEQDVVWVWGGSVAGLLAMWRGTTDSFGPTLRPITDGLGLLPFSNGVHYDSEEQRRPLFQSLVADGTLPTGYATDDGAGVLYQGTEMVGAYTERAGAGAYLVERDGDRAVETELDVVRL